MLETCRYKNPLCKSRTARLKNSLVAYLAYYFQQNAKNKIQRCTLQRHQQITQNDVYSKYNDVINIMDGTETNYSGIASGIGVCLIF